ncbi:DUF4893 domain-containing protein [Sphingomonas sp.]|uniref:DUF4893 domain-containing protein n=1 Tax=Sphingomonas sp. TaxID=28214 RepID=UPI002C2C0780|nr:DUF4893 domain-containing protein [Sphingomonas sp.]HTG38164.1 DUF4893 domain-containing protein [Sphingomonas sp.]
MHTRFSKRVVVLGLLLMTAACGGARLDDAPVRAAADAAPPAGWRTVATEHDRDRLRRWRDAWMAALPPAQAAAPAAIREQGQLFHPDHALADPAPPPGRYRCRVFKLGAAGAAGLAFTPYPYFNCRVGDEGDVLSLFKETGSQRPVGLLFPDGPSRMIFLGTLALGDEQRALDYGQDRDRDMAGVLERVGERRWRLSLPWPRFESQLDVVELIPAP